VKICLYCETPADSLEHVIPAAFGELLHAPNLDGRICRACNTRLGLLDEQLARCGPEAMLRRFYNIQGRASHDSVNPFERGSAKGQRIEFAGWDEEKGIEVNLEIVDGVCRQLREIVFVETESGKTHHLPVKVGMTAEQLRASFVSLQVAKPFLTHCSFSKEEEQWVRQLMMDAFPTATSEEATPMSTVYKVAVSKHTVTDRYFRAFAKIGFHYFLSQFPHYSGHEPIFEDIRKVIYDDVGTISRIGEFVVAREPHLFSEFLDAKGQPPQGARLHFVDCGFAPGICIAHVRLFVSSDWVTPTYTVRLAHDPAAVERKAAGHAFIYYPDGRKGKYSGEAAPLTINVGN
jgi:hypothetical protein